ncbi:MAG: 50S ribosomal protein L9 [Syntrophomonadaceae bacterium]|nr:50S ribosomal protein L9 [Syntrophomonadaceae bacterium]
MKVILIQDVKKLGSKGQIMEVSDGYGRNYLIPQGLAEEATKTRLKEIEEKGIKAEKKKNAEKEKAEIMKSKLHGQQVNIKVKTGSGDRLFGAVTPKEIAEVLQENFGVTIDKKKIEVGEPIKHVGNYTINIKIYPAVQAEVKLKVAPE